MNRSDCALSVNLGFRVAVAFGFGFAPILMPSLS